jgi:hypothetical protein
MDNLTFSRVDSYKFLIDGNSLAEFPYTSIESLKKINTVLDVSGNCLRILRNSFTRVNRVYSLVLRNNTIERIEYSFFENLRHLFILDLSVNKLSTLTNHTFSALIYLKNLNLSGNFIEAIPQSIFQI